jgi:FlaG/FlaF family flagellin (archaellin)
MSKGISPLVAAVLLIATTMSIAGILTYWATGFVRSRLGVIENASETECLSAQFRLYYGSFDNGTESLYLTLENQRNTDLKLENLYLMYPDGSLDSKVFPNATLEGNKLKQFNITNVNDGFLSGKIKTDCSEVFIDFTYSQLTIT